MTKNEREDRLSRGAPEIDRVVHEPARLLILSILRVVESADFLFLLDQTGLSKGNLSSHLAKLESAGYVDVRKEFVEKIPRTLLTITTQGAEALNRYRDSLTEILRDLPE